MKHLGDITKLNGAEIPVVDIITGGSPCQDLSVAGLRKGIKHEENGDEETTRSGLFMDQLRIVKEMRERERATGRTGWMVRPRYMVWENVPGAFSSGNPKGADFAAVIEEIIKVAEPGASVSVCVPNGGWTKSGCYYAEDGSWSLAWRVHDAQFWGVPQRRKRIALVADFGGLSAPEILFERKGLSGDSEPCAETREGVAAEAESGAGGTGFGETGMGYWQNGIQTLRAEGENRPSRQSNVIVSVHATQDPIVTVYGIDRADTAGCNGKGWREDQCYTLNTIDRPAVMAFAQNQVGEVRVSPMSGTLNTNSNATGRNSPLVYDARGNGDGEIAPTMTGDHQNRVTDYTALCVGNGQANQSVSDKAGALNTCSKDSNAMKSANPNSGFYEAETTRTLDANGGNPVCNQGGMVVVAFAQNQRDEVRDLENRAGALAANPGAKQQTYVLQGSMIGRADRNGPQGSGVNEDVSFTINATDRHGVAYGIDRAAYNQGQGAKFNPCIEYEPEPTMVARGPGAVAHPVYSTSKNFVRRLTPLECERLQGYPDGWTDIGDWVDSKGKKHKGADSPRYKALGNSIALPFWFWLLRRISGQYERPATMGSLFDGIGGFPLTALRSGIKPLWASEIEAFPIAVCKKHFGDEDAGIEGDVWKYL